MRKITFESIKEDDEGYKLFFTSYLRTDFIEKSVVISLRKNFTISNIYITSYDFGSVEWINGIGLDQCRQWETDEQAESSGYLTRRYTSRISDGLAPDGLAEKHLIPDIIDNLENREIAKILESVLKVKKSKRTIIPYKYGLE